MLQVLYVLYFVVGLALSVWLVVVLVRSKRRLDRRIAEVDAELQDDTRPRPDPWTALAQLYGDDAAQDQGTGDKKRSA